MRKADEEFAHYRIESLLGQGGMGEVYRAFDTKLHRRVALKLLLTTGTTTDEAKADAVARIIREARAAAALEHPNKVSIFELGEVDGTPYLAMEYIAGSTLRAFVGDDSVPWTRKLGWLLDVARALDAAHVAGLVHRDIKPDNVMVREDGVVKVLDFGIARRAAAVVDPSAPTAAPSIETLTGKGVIVGTAAYMPAEQVHGDELDGRADQFSWGVMAFELLSGEHPWARSGGDALALVGAMLTKPAPRLEGVPDAVADAVGKTLRSSRDDRFSRMSEIVSLLAPLAGQSGPIPVVSAREDRVASAVTDAAMARTEASDEHEIGSQAPSTSRGRLSRAAFAAASVVAVALGAGAWWWTSAQPSVSHCADYVMTSAGPRCVGAVPPAAVSQRSQTYRLTAGRAGVETVERLNSAGIVGPIWNAQELVARVEIRRDADGRVREVVAREQNGGEQWHEVWSEAGTRADYTEADGKTPRHVPGGRATTVRRELDGRGFVRRELYFGPTGKPRPSGSGVFGRELEHGLEGFCTRETHLGADGKPMADKNGVATVVRVTDARGVELERRTLDVTGNPLLVDGVATRRGRYTAALAFEGETFLDGSGAPVPKLSYGTHGIRIDRDPGARKLSVTFLDEADKPRQRKGDAYARVEYTMDERGREIDLTYRDATGNTVVAAESGVASWRKVWSDRDQIAERHALDPTRRPMTGRWGYATRVDVTDDRGRVVELRHFDVAGRPAPWLDGPAIAKYTYDDRGLFTEVADFDGDSRPATRSAGISVSRRKYDRLRNEIELAFFGTDGKPVLSDEGLSIVRRRYDADDNLVEESYFDTAGAPTFVEGFAKKRRQYDDRGFVVEEAYFDTNDNPVLIQDGYAVVRRVRDRSGDVVEESYLGKRGEPVMRGGGYAKKKNVYDLQRRRVETALFDAGGAPVRGSDGWSIERIGYDARGLVVRESWLDVAKMPIVVESGSASVTKRYDGRGNLVEVTLLDAGDEPVVGRDGWAVKKSSYDERDQLIEEALLGADGTPTVAKKGWSVRKLRYDELGNLADESFFDAERKPAIAKDPPYARKRDKYDARRRLVETSYFDPSGAPAKGPEGVETIRYVRDAYGHAVETAYLDAAGAPAVSRDGKMVVRSKYDDVGRLLEESFVDASGKPRAAKDGCAGRRSKYDEQGRKIEETCIGEDGAPAISADGWASRRTLRDARGLVVDEATFGADAKLRADATGVARRKNRYDARGLLLETTFWSADDKPAKDKRGAVAVRYRYDDAGKRIEESAVDGK